MNTDLQQQDPENHPDGRQPTSDSGLANSLPSGDLRELAAFAGGDLRLLLTTDLATTLVAQLPLLTGVASDWPTMHTAVFRALGDASLSTDPDLRQRAIMVLSLILADSRTWQNHLLLLRLSGLLNDWLEQEKEYIDGFEVLAKQLEALGIWLVENDYWAEVRRLFFTMSQISLGRVTTNTIIGRTVGRVLTGIATPDTLAKVLVHVLGATGSEGKSAELLLGLGRNAIIFVMNRLMHSTVKDERLDLVQLLPQIGAEAVPFLLECLQRKPVWYIVRNIVQVLARIETPVDYRLVETYLQHPDLRVQLAVVDYIEKKEPEQARSRLLAALQSAGEELRLILVEKLLADNDPTVGTALIELLHGRHRFFPRRWKQILPSLVLAMRNFATKDSVDVLHEVIGEYRRQSDQRKIVLLAEESLGLIEPVLRHGQRANEAAADDDGLVADLLERQPGQNNQADFDEEIAALLARKDKDGAGQKIYERILTAARDKDFTAAEQLSERLLAVNPSAIALAVRAGEIIEEEMSTSITSRHLAVWEGLYEMMTEEEFNALYLSLKRERYEAGEVIVQAGETSAMLYFINSGLVGMSCRTGNGETFLQKIKAGDIQGAEQFFADSVWTTTMRAQSKVELHVLDRQTLNLISPAHPMLGEKLRTYCRRGNAVYDLLKMSGQDRREYPRYHLSRQVESTLLNPLGGERARKLRVELVDITRGGLCVALRIANKENAQLLLGRHLETEIPLDGEEALACVGTIVGITFLAAFSREFTLHIRLFEELSQAQVTKIAQAKD